MFLFIVLEIFFCPSVNGIDGECFSIVWNEEFKNYVTEYYCCDDYERVNGTCIECKTGYTSAKGNQCEPCQDKSYGIKCLSSCQCTDSQRCHYVLGCILLPSKDHHLTTEDYSTSAEENTKIYDRKKEEDDDQNSGLFSQKIVVYSMCVSGILIVITVCYVCTKRLQNTRTIKRLNDIKGINKKHENSRSNGVRRELPNPVILLNEVQFESAYEEIDEIDIDESITSFERHVNTTDGAISEISESENEETLEDDGYLHPYQQMVDDPDSHDYTTSIATSSESKEIQLRKPHNFWCVKTMSNNHLSLTDGQDLDALDQQSTCAKGYAITNTVNEKQLNASKNLQNYEAKDVLNLEKYSTSMFQLSIENNTFGQTPAVLSFNKRMSI